MRTMADTIARLAALRESHGGSDVDVPDRLSTLTDFGANPGALSARVYRPSDLPAAAPLVVVLHGCKQNAAAYDHRAGWSRLADEAGFALLYPEQRQSNNPNLCFNWFQPGDARRDAGEALSIRHMIEAMIVGHGIDRDRIFVTGLSAGGAMASVMLAAYPEVFAGGAVVAGLAYGRAATVPEAFERMRGNGTASEVELRELLRSASGHSGPWPRVTVWHGAADHTVAASNAGEVAAQWRGVHRLGAAPARTEVAGARTRQVWCDAAGEVVIEVNTIAGMGHGTPVGDGLGVAGPFMLDVGISSTREIARFWGITREREAAVTGRMAATSGGRPGPAPGFPGNARRAPEAERPHAAAKPLASAASGVKKIIEDALRAAGLMR